MSFVLDFRERSKGGAVTSGVLSGASLDDLRRKTAVTFLVHGYNVNRTEGRRSLRRLAARLSSRSDTAMVLVLWPGDHWMGMISYPFEGRDADQTGSALARYVAEIAALRRSTRISFVSHSLGARVAMEAARGLDARGYAMTQICLMAAAIDNSSLSNSRAYRPTVERSGRVAVLSSRKDRVLKYAYPAGDLLQGFLFAGDVADFALGYSGPRGHKSEKVPDRVLAEPISKDRKSDHGHYIPGPKKSTSQKYKNQLSAADYADDVLSGHPAPEYQ